MRLRSSRPPFLTRIGRFLKNKRIELRMFLFATLLMNARLQKPPFMAEAGRYGKKKNVWLEILIFFAVYMIASSIQSIILSVPMIAHFFADGVLEDIMSCIADGDFFGAVYSVQMPEYVTITMLFSTVVIIACSMLYCGLIEKRPIRTMGLVRRNAVGEYLLGMAAGLLTAAAAMGICAAAGVVSFDGFSESASWLIAVYFAGFVIQGMSEEVLLRGFFMVSLSRGRSIYPAVFINAAAFALMHLLNPGITPVGMLNIFIFGVFASVYIIKRGNLWGAAAMHTMWNFSLANIFGTEVSGMEIGTSVFSVSTNEAAEWLHGGAFGSEGGLAVTIVFAAALLIIWLLPGKKSDSRI